MALYKEKKNRKVFYPLWNVCGLFCTVVSCCVIPSSDKYDNILDGAAGFHDGYKDDPLSVKRQ